MNWFLSLNLLNKVSAVIAAVSGIVLVFAVATANRDYTIVSAGIGLIALLKALNLFTDNGYFDGAGGGSDGGDGGCD
ncbi:hypothetical protein [Octadecabacter ascidiaceicola]|uniref:Uncharacterized protein n=1 Tax=Octadecabacter ascidiaceicola TaxID=1655543 RepID=A0A238KM37_9RHOB|nr:hypothetical protein [Octadecabacter ascidiaceicola]SMX43811.1 hypothetical protein OCA8868_03044 [Octadecabacter ascidiaceicola]